MEVENLVRSAPPETYRFIAMNLQRFKLINDSFGQKNGDRALRHVYDTVSSLLDEGDLITRASADDFYILTKAKTKEAQKAALRLYSERINSYNFKSGEKYFINLSFGVVLVDDPRLSLVQLRDRDNIARKNARRAYGELFSLVFYSDLERRQMLKEKDIENRMEDALRDGELTESMVFENLDALIEVIGKIHAAGFLCAMDDFGSGYSSLNMLTDIHVDSLKLDRAFWKPGREGDRAHDAIAMVVELGKRLDMLTVSEGVETADQLEFLRKIRCDLVQGYVLSKPVPPPEFEKLAFGKSLSGRDAKPADIR